MSLTHIWMHMWTHMCMRHNTHDCCFLPAHIQFAFIISHKPPPPPRTVTIVLTCDTREETELGIFLGAILNLDPPLPPSGVTKRRQKAFSWDLWHEWWRLCGFCLVFSLLFCPICVCECVCEYVCVCVCVHTYSYRCIDINMYTCKCIQYIYIYIHICMWLYDKCIMYLYIYMYMCIYIYMYMCMWL